MVTFHEAQCRSLFIFSKKKKQQLTKLWKDAWGCIHDISRTAQDDFLSGTYLRAGDVSVPLLKLLASMPFRDGQPSKPSSALS